jgi:signal transduction histidine kinase
MNDYLYTGPIIQKGPDRGSDQDASFYSNSTRESPFAPRSRPEPKQAIPLTNAGPNSGDSLERSRNSGCQSQVKILKSRRKAERQKLLEVTRALTRIQEPQDFFQSVINSAVELTGAERGFLLLLESQSPDQSLDYAGLVPVASFRLAPETMHHRDFRASRSAINEALRSKNGLHIASSSRTADVQHSVAQFGVRSVVVEPILMQEQVLGVLYLDSTEHSEFQAEHLEMLPSFTAQVAICLENLRLLAEREAALRRQHQEHARLLEVRVLKETMSNFLRTASHDLKGPLTILTTGLALLKRKGLLDSEEILREDMETALARSTRLLSNYLDLERAGRGQALELFKGEVLLEFLVSEELRTLKGQLGEARARLFSFEIEFGSETTVWADRKRLSQIVEHLLAHAVKYNPDGGSISISHKRLQGNDILRFRDRGLGMSKEARLNALEPFRREGTEDKVHGLGLYIVKQLVEAHGGALDIESEVGHGTTVWVVLPRPPRV